MNVLDENILESQRQLLLKWHVPFRQIGCEIERKGLKDDEIIPFLRRLRHATLFTILAARKPLLLSMGMKGGKFCPARRHTITRMCQKFPDCHLIAPKMERVG